MTYYTTRHLWRHSIDTLPNTLHVALHVDFLELLYCDVTIEQLFDGPFDWDIMMNKSCQLPVSSKDPFEQGIPNFIFHNSFVTNMSDEELILQKQKIVSRFIYYVSRILKNMIFGKSRDNIKAYWIYGKLQADIDFLDNKARHKQKQ